MRRLLSPAALAANVALGGCQTLPPPTGPSTASAVKAEQDCNGMSRYNPAPGVNPAALSAERMDDMHLSVRGANAVVRPEGGPILRTRIGGGPPSPRLTEESSIVHRDPSGVWRISRVELNPYDIAEPQWEVIEGQEPTPLPVKANRRIFEGPLPEATAKLIEAALAGPCFRDGPVSPPPRPAREEPEKPCPPDSSGYSLEIIENGRSRTYFRSCHATWTGGSLLDLVAGSYPELRDRPVKP